MLRAHCQPFCVPAFAGTHEAPYLGIILAFSVMSTLLPTIS